MPSNWPSRACFACKAKKVKCDEISPSCQRCLKSGIACAYRPESDLIFRDMRSVTEKKVKTRVKARMARRESSPATSVSASSTPANSFKIVSQCIARDIGDHELKISPPMSTNWREIAVPRFFADYVFESAFCLQSGLSFLPELCGRTDLRAPLREALNAVACLSLSNQLGINWLKTEACRYYFHAVEVMAKLCRDPDEVRQDDALATNYLFGMFELISGFRLSGTAWARYRHHQGRVSLLRLRGKEHFTTPVGINIFRVSYCHVTMKTITEHIMPTDEAQIWLESIPRKDPGLQLAKPNLRTACLCYEAQALFDSDSDDEWWIVKMLQIVKEAILIDLEYQEWTESLPAIWRKRNLRKSGTTSTKEDNTEPISHVFPQHVYEDIYIAFISNNYRAARIHLHEVLLRCVSLIESHPHAETSFNAEQTRIQSRAIISEMISDICASTSYCLGDINSTGDLAPTGYRMPLGGYLVIWSHWRAYVSAPEGSKSKLWLRTKLEYISNSMGILAARTVTNRTIKNPWDLRTSSNEGKNPHEY